MHFSKICYNKIIMDTEQEQPAIHRFKAGLNFKLLVAVLVVSVIAGVGTGYLMASSGAGKNIPIINKTPEHAVEDTRTFRDFAEGKITKKPEDKKSATSQGTHLLIRDGATPVVLTSSVLDLSEYENKKVKLFGETNSLPGAGWFMDVGRVEVIQ